LSKDDNPGHGNPGSGFVTTQFCDERARRIEEKIDGMQVKILSALKEKNGLSWQAKATILGSFIMGISSIAVALIYVCG